MSNMHYAYHQLVQIDVRMNSLDWVQCAQEEVTISQNILCNANASLTLLLVL